MKFICPTVFVLIFLCGSFFLLGRLKNPGNASKNTPAAVPQKTAPETDQLPPLYLPSVFKGKPCPENSWETAGTAEANFVSTRAQLTAWLQNQSWKAAKEIQIGTNVNPKVLLTFERGDFEVIFQLSRRSVDQTDFAYRREKKQTVRKGLAK